MATEIVIGMVGWVLDGMGNRHFVTVLEIDAAGDLFVSGATYYGHCFRNAFTPAAGYRN